RNDPLLAALSPHLYLLRNEIEIAQIDASELGKSHAGGIEHLEAGEVPNVREAAAPRARLGLLEQQVDLRTVEVAGQTLVELGRADATGRVRRHLLVSMHEPIEASYRRQGARDRALRETTPSEVAHETTNREAVYTLPRPLARPVVGREERDQLVQVAAVCPHSVRRIIAFFLEVLEKVRNLIGEGRLRRRVVHRDTALGLDSARQASIAATARAAKSSRLRRLSRSGCSSSSNKAKFAFIGWKCSGRASRR